MILLVEEKLTVVKVSIVIKTLNEEENIRRAIKSALAAVAGGSEVVVADSASTDLTIEVAKEFPVTIVQITNPAERCCGVGPQLGYQHTKGDYIYILDGDMELKASFLQRAIEILDNEPDVAGVGGYIHEMRVEHLEVQGQINRVHRLRRKRPAEVQCLNGGGLYRRSAIEDVVYFSDRNLHAFEEYDLGARLRVKGWRLVKLEEQAVDHYSYAMSTWRVFWHRLCTGRFISSGELLSAAVRGSYIKNAVSETRIIQLAIGVWIYWALAFVISYRLSGTGPIVILILLALLVPLLTMTIRHRSLKLALYSILTWHIAAVGILIGLSRRRRPPSDRIESQVLQTAPIADGNRQGDRAALRRQGPAPD
jgi:glycosyltransferase involved in cell wall biosynthesis